MSGKKKNLSGKRPSNGANLSDRRSNLRSKGKAWKEQLVQGVTEKEIADALKLKLDAQRKLMQDEKQRLKNEARLLDIELGFVDPNVKIAPNKMPEWKKQKLFLNDVFPPPVICRKFNGVMVYRNKLSMQEYQHRVITPEEWDLNAALLDEMRALYDQEKATERGESATEEDGDDDESNDNGDNGDEQDEEEEEDGEDEGIDEGGDDKTKDEGAAPAQLSELSGIQNTASAPEEEASCIGESVLGRESEGDEQSADQSEEGEEQSEEEALDEAALASMSINEH